jgi:hypothetical protein
MDRVCNIFQASHSQQVVRHKLLHAEPTLAHPIILCKTCSVLLCVLEQSRVDNSNVGHLKREIQLGGIGPNGLMPALLITFLGGGNRSNLRRS